MLNPLVNSIETIWAVFEKASRNLAHPLSTKDIERLVRPSWFISDLMSNAGPQESQLPKPNVTNDIDGAIALASDVRLLLGQDDLHPISELPKFLEEVFEIEIVALDHEVISAACAVFEGHQFIYFSRNDELNALYWCARQLGHLFLHAIDERRSAATIELAHENTHAPMGRIKRFADYFALELLIPTRGLGVALKEIRSLLKVKNPALGDVELLYLSRIFNVSFLNMARRCERANLLPKGGAQALNARISEKHGGPESRANALDLPARAAIVIHPLPKPVLRRMKKLAVGSPNFVDEAARQLGFSPSYVRQIAGIHQ